MPIVKDSVAILSPCANSVEPAAYRAAMALVAGAGNKGIKVTQIGVTERTLVHTARNWLAEGLLASDCEWGFWLDSDMVLPSNTLRVMLEWAKKLDARFLTGFYYQRLGKHRPLVLIRQENKSTWGGFNINPPEGCTTPIRADYCGFGCVLTHRSMFEQLPRPFFKYQVDDQGRDYSEDFYFCDLAREANIPLWAIPELECFHIGQAPLIGRANYTEKTEQVEVKAFELGKPAQA